MAHIFRFSYSSTTLALTSGDYQLIQHTQITAEDGAEYVDESATIRIKGSDLADFQANVRAITQMFEKARERQSGMRHQRVFLQKSGDGETVTYQAEIYDGRVVLPSTLWEVDWANLTVGVDVEIVYRRAPVWEGTSWTAVPLTNLNGTDVTSAGIRVYNCDDSSGTSPAQRCNYVDVDGANDISGELPAAVRITLGGPSADIKTIYVGSLADVAGFGVLGPTHRECEMMITGSGSASADVDSDASNGYVKTINLAGSDGFEVYIYYSGMEIGWYAGGYYKFFVTALDNDLEGVRFYADMGLAGLSAPSVTAPADTFVLPLGELPIPPNMDQLPIEGTTGVLLENPGLYIGYDTAKTLKLDVMFFFPTDSWLEMSADDTLIPTGSRLVVSNDQVSQCFVYVVATGVRSTPVQTMKGSGLRLWPGVDNRIRFLTAGAGGVYDPASYMSIWMYYKPRRLTV